MAAIPNSENMTPAFILGQAIQALKEHRAALERLNDIYTWLSGFVAADFEVAPLSMSATSATALFSAVTDARNEYVNRNLGLPAVLPATGYKYGATQDALVGPT